MRSGPSPSPRAARAGFVDWLRLVAAFQMIQGHVIDALLVDSARSGRIYETWTWVRGLTAPAFLVASGLSFHLASKLGDPAGFARLVANPGARRRRVVRSAWLVVLGTLLHAADAPWVVDVLQCVGVTLLVLDGVVSLAPSPRAVRSVAVVLAVLAVALALPASSLEGQGAMRFVVGYVSRTGGSLFPLLPWSAFVLAGVALGPVLLPDGAATEGAHAAARLAVVAAVSVGVALVLELVLPAPSAADYSAHPAIVALRLGVVLAVASVLAMATRAIHVPRWVSTLAGETLFLYVGHLVVLYADVVGPAHRFEHALDVPVALGVALVFLIATPAAALGWARLWPPVESRLFPWLRPAPTGRREGGNE